MTEDGMTPKPPDWTSPAQLAVLKERKRLATFAYAEALAKVKKQEEEKED